MTWQMVGVLLGTGVTIGMALITALAYLVRELAKTATLLPGLQLTMQSIVTEIQKLNVQVGKFEERLLALEDRIERAERTDNTPLPRRR